MDHTRFFELLKSGEISGLYLFHGEEEYVKQSALSQLIERIDPVSRDMNVQEFEKPNADSVQLACETLPFFAETRLVVCREIADSVAKQLIAYAPTMPPTTTLILYIRGKCGASLLQAAKDLKRDVAFDRLTQQDATRFVLQRLRKRGAQIDQDTARTLVEMVGVEVHALLNELNKAADYAGTEPITPETLRACVTPNPEFKRYQMLDDLLAGKQVPALRALRRMLRDSSETPFGLAYFLAGQCKTMLSVRMLMDSGLREQDAGKRLGLYSGQARSAAAGAKRLTAEQLRNAVLAFSSVDYLQVTGKAPADRMLEMAVLQYFCGGTEKRRAAR
jgi:DNA polymerase III delta subunit